MSAEYSNILLMFLMLFLGGFTTYLLTKKKEEAKKPVLDLPLESKVIQEKEEKKLEDQKKAVQAEYTDDVEGFTKHLDETTPVGGTDKEVNDYLLQVGKDIRGPE